MCESVQSERNHNEFEQLSMNMNNYKNSITIHWDEKSNSLLKIKKWINPERENHITLQFRDHLDFSDCFEMIFMGCITEEKKWKKEQKRTSFLILFDVLMEIFKITGFLSSVFLQILWTVQYFCRYIFVSAAKDIIFNCFLFRNKIQNSFLWNGQQFS